MNEKRTLIVDVFILFFVFIALCFIAMLFLQPESVKVKDIDQRLSRIEFLFGSALESQELNK